MLSAEKRFAEVIPLLDVTLRGTEDSHAESEVVVKGFLGFSQPPASRRDGAAGAGAGSLSCSEEESCGSSAERAAAREASLDVSGRTGGGVVDGVSFEDDLVDGSVSSAYER